MQNEIVDPVDCDFTKGFCGDLCLVYEQHLQGFNYAVSFLLVSWKNADTPVLL